MRRLLTSFFGADEDEDEVDPFGFPLLPPRASLINLPALEGSNRCLHLKHDTLNVLSVGGRPLTCSADGGTYSSVVRQEGKGHERVMKFSFGRDGIVRPGEGDSGRDADADADVDADADIVRGSLCGDSKTVSA